VPLVIDLPFLSPLRKLIGKAAYAFSLGSFGGVRVILPFLRILIFVFAFHCAIAFLSLCIRDAIVGSKEQPSV